MESKLRIIFVAFADNSLGRRILYQLSESGRKPLAVCMASPEALKKFRKNRIKKFFRENGFLDTLWRIMYRLTLRQDVKSESKKQDKSTTIPIKQMADDYGIPLWHFNNINSTEFLERLHQQKPDLIVLGGAPIIKQTLIDLPSIAVLNSHPAVLPEAKGMDVIAHSILNDIPLGVTVFKVDKGIDTGDVILLEKYGPIARGKTLTEIESEIEKMAADAMIKSVAMIENNQAKFVKQKGEGNLFHSIGVKLFKRVQKKLASL